MSGQSPYGGEAALTSLINVAIPAMTVVLLTAVGLDLTRADFARLRQQRGLVSTGLLAPLVLLPAIAVGLAWLFQTTPDVSVGVLLVALSPIGAISNTFSYLAEASPALAVALTGLSCACASITIPLVGMGVETVLAQPVEVKAPLAVLAAQVFIVLALPVVLGMSVRRRWPMLASRYSPALRRLAFAAVCVVLLLIIFEDVGAFVGQISTTVPVATAFVVVSTVAGWLIASLVALDPRDRFTTAVAFGTRNIGVAAAIAVSLLGRVEFARFAAAYFLTETPLMLLCVALFRRYGRRRAVA